MARLDACLALVKQGTVQRVAVAIVKRPETRQNVDSLHLFIKPRIIPKTTQSSALHVRTKEQNHKCDPLGLYKIALYGQS